MSRILVSGATGFVGRRLTRRLVAEHGRDAVACLIYRDAESDAERSGRAVLAGLGVRCIPVDLVSAAGLQEAPRQPKLLFHLASNIDTGARDHRVDDLGTRNLLEAIGPLGPHCRVIFASSIAVMDNREPRRDPATERSQMHRPFSEYGRRKLLAEEYLLARAAEQGFALVVARLCAVYGEGTRDNGIFGHIGEMVRRDAWIARLDYPGKISLMHVDDMVDVLLRLVHEPVTAGQGRLVLLASEVLSVAEIIAAACRRYGKIYRPLPLPPIFWRSCENAARLLFRLHPLLPHVLANKLWQLGLTVTPTLYFDPTATRARYPDLHFRKFSDSLAEIW